MGSDKRRRAGSDSLCVCVVLSVSEKCNGQKTSVSSFSNSTAAGPYE
jgi:hypothetical protein